MKPVILPVLSGNLSIPLGIMRAFLFAATLRTLSEIEGKVQNIISKKFSLPI